MNRIADELDRILNRQPLTLADWCDRVCYGVVVFSLAYLAAHLVAWYFR